MTETALKTYLSTCSLPTAERVVTGHPAPDADAVVSALFEAWRLTRKGEDAVPVLQGAMPCEVAWLLGSSAELVPSGPIPATAALVLTDHHDVTAYPNPVTAVVDHHPVADATLLNGVAAEIDLVGAATTLVARRIRADGIRPDPFCARVLLGAILLDTEGLSDYKAKIEDVEMAAWLYDLCGEDMHRLYAELRSRLLSETDVAALYHRDYRLYTAADGTPLLGWGILKVWAEACPDLEEVRRLLAEDTAPTRVAKIILYSREDATRTEWYLAAGDGADAFLDAVQSRSGEAAVRAASDIVYLPAECRRWGRKRYAAALNEILGKKG